MIILSSETERLMYPSEIHLEDWLGLIWKTVLTSGKFVAMPADKRMKSSWIRSEFWLFDDSQSDMSKNSKNSWKPAGLIYQLPKIQWNPALRPPR